MTMHELLPIKNPKDQNCLQSDSPTPKFIKTSSKNLNTETRSATKNQWTICWHSEFLNQLNECEAFEQAANQASNRKPDSLLFCMQISVCEFIVHKIHFAQLLEYFFFNFWRKPFTSWGVLKKLLEIAFRLVFNSSILQFLRSSYKFSRLKDLFCWALLKLTTSACLELLDTWSKFGSFLLCFKISFSSCLAMIESVLFCPFIVFSY